MVRFIIIRHGYSLGNKEKRFSGQLDVPLDEIGRAQAQSVADYILKHYKILDDFGLKDENIQFLSYRKQKAVVSPDKDIFISIYKLNGKAMAVVVNKQNTERTVTVNIDWKKLGIMPGAALKDMRTGKALSKGDSVTLRIPGYNFALIQIGE